MRIAPANCAGHADIKLQPCNTGLRGGLGGHLVQQRRTDADAIALKDFGAGKGRRQADHHARHPAIPYKRVGARTQHMDGNVFRRLGKKAREIGLICRQVEHLPQARPHAAM